MAKSNTERSRIKRARDKAKAAELAQVIEEKDVTRYNALMAHVTLILDELTAIKARLGLHQDPSQAPATGPAEDRCDPSAVGSTGGLAGIAAPQEATDKAALEAEIAALRQEMELQEERTAATKKNLNRRIEQLEANRDEAWKFNRDLDDAMRRYSQQVEKALQGLLPPQKDAMPLETEDQALAASFGPMAIDFWEWIDSQTDGMSQEKRAEFARTAAFPHAGSHWRYGTRGDAHAVFTDDNGLQVVIPREPWGITPHLARALALSDQKDRVGQQAGSAGRSGNGEGN
ncbi:hypothetical protein BB934_43785 (plasmid) [Microvirga ossetica]|uniref:Uncharacterized protein n=2 Tax=Microvirga ossetica TaxID=1882682 RepID=A0A1B2EYV5_9HYPH|nr:hypothetical protein BB934_43785 [Microvirga ossetica]